MSDQEVEAACVGCQFFTGKMSDYDQRKEAASAPCGNCGRDLAVHRRVHPHASYGGACAGWTAKTPAEK